MLAKCDLLQGLCVPLRRINPGLATYFISHTYRVASELHLYTFCLGIEGLV